MVSEEKIHVFENVDRRTMYSGVIGILFSSLRSLWLRLANDCNLGGNSNSIRLFHDFTWITDFTRTSNPVIFFGWLVLLLYVPSQQLWSLREGQFT